MDERTHNLLKFIKDLESENQTDLSLDKDIRKIYSTVRSVLEQFIDIYDKNINVPTVTSDLRVIEMYPIYHEENSPYYNFMVMYKSKAYFMVTLFIIEDENRIVDISYNINAINSGQGLTYDEFRKLYNPTVTEDLMDKYAILRSLMGD